MTRPGLWASRSSTLQLTDTPVARSVTVTTVPNASVGLAQVPAGELYHDAPPVLWCAGAVTTGAATGFGAGAGTGAGGLGAATTATATAAGGFGATTGGGGVVVVVVVVGGNT